MKRFALAVAFAAAITYPALAQGDPSQAPSTDSGTEPPTAGVPASPAAEPSSEPPSGAPKKKRKKAPPSPWEFQTFMRHVSDSNIDQDRYNISSHGLIYGLGARYETELPSGDLELSYVVADHSYTNTFTWDRTTHNAEASFQHRLGRQWYTQTTGEIALKDASDDGDIRDEYTLQQRLEYRVTPVIRVRLDGALRVRKYDDDPGRDASAPYIGIALDQRWSGGRRWLVGYRHEDNNADEAKRSYRRATFHTLLERNIGKRDAVSVEARYRLKRYTERVVSTGGVETPRRDRNWEVGAAYVYTPTKGLELTLDYLFENRRSNDARRVFDDNLYGVTVTHRW